VIPGKPKPLIIVTADKDAEYAIQELVRRPAALGIRPIDFDCFRHPRRDNGVLNEVHDFLRPFLQWEYALVILDREGCGHEDEPRDVLEKAVEDRLSANGWPGRSRVVVLDPELEAWIWDGSYQVNRILNWPGGAESLKRWIGEQGFVGGGEFKPARPKEALDSALRHRGIRHSSALFRDLAKEFKFENCRDRAFQRLVSTLRGWFPETHGETSA
jgi:hypothetical protein